MDVNYFAGLWPLLCQPVRSHVAVIGRLALGEAAELLNSQAARFCGQAPPTDADGLLARTID